MASNDEIIELSTEISRDQLQECLNKCISELSSLCTSCEVLTKNMEEILRKIRQEQQKAMAILRIEVTHAFDR